ncbi:trypsin-like peptidase domain-containing protein [Solidesulfovibrio sp.]
MTGRSNSRRRGRAAICRAALAMWLGLFPGAALADFDDALRAYERGDAATALRELRPLLKSGSPAAAWLMGRLRETGRGGTGDAAEAAVWYRKAAAGGNVPAMLALAELHLRGRGVPQSDARAGEWLKKAAAKGSAQGLFLLGLLRLDGRLGPASDAPAYLRRAVAAGSGDAAMVLGELYLTGRIVAQNPAEAYRLALAAAASGRVAPGAAARLTALTRAAEKELPPAQAQSLRAKAGSGKPPAPVPPPAGKLRTGTGFVVSRVGHVLTNAHVAQGCGRLEAVIDGRPVAATLVRFDAGLDLALLRLAVAPSRALTFREGSDLPPGTPVFAAGYPGDAARTGQLRLTSGRTRELAAGAGNAKDMAVSAEVLPGNSGGPLLDAGGRVAGVVRARRDTAAVREQVGAGVADVGFAVPLGAVKAFLAQGQIPIATAPTSRTLDASALERELSGVVIPLVCRAQR